MKFVYVAAIALLFPVIAAANNGYDVSANPAEELLVTEVVMNTRPTDDDTAIHIVGQASNSSDHTLSEIKVEVKLFDGQGKMVEAFSRTLRDVSLPPKGKTAFSLDARGSEPPINYKRVEIRPTFAATWKKPEESRLVDVLIQYFPLAVFIGIFLYYIKRTVGPQSIVAEQNTILRSQDQTLNRIHDQLKQLAEKH